MNMRDDVIECLRTSELFSGIGDSDLLLVADLLHRKEFSGREVLFRQGDPGTQMFLVQSGRVVSMARDSDGNEREVYEFGPGRFFGEMSIIDNVARSATCEVLEDSVLLALDAIDFYRIVWEHATIGVRMLSSMSRIMAGWLDEASVFLHDTVRWGETARRRAVMDELSGLFNRRFLEDTIKTRFSRAVSAPPQCALLMLDIDYFHEINETYGHEAGDAVISTTGAGYGHLLPENCVAARLSGDEFAFFLADGSKREAMELAEKIRAHTETLYMEFRNGKDAAPARVHLTASIGVAVSPADAVNSGDLYVRADQVLFKAKEAGRNRVLAYS